MSKREKLAKEKLGGNSDGKKKKVKGEINNKRKQMYIPVAKIDIR